MSFNFSQFLNAVNTALPAIGQTVEALHPGDNKEAVKIELGTALFSAFVTCLQQSARATAASGSAPVQ